MDTPLTFAWSGWIKALNQKYIQGAKCKRNNNWKITPIWKDDRISGDFNIKWGLGFQCNNFILKGFLLPQISWVFDCKGAGLKNMDIEIINWNTEVGKNIWQIISITTDIKGIGIFEWNLNGNQCHDFEWWSVATCPVFLAKDLLYLFIFHYWYWTLPFSAWNITTHTSWTWFTSSRCPGSWTRVSRLKHRITNTISLIVEIDGQKKFCLLLKFQSHGKRTHFLSHCNF